MYTQAFADDAIEKGECLECFDVKRLIWIRKRGGEFFIQFGLDFGVAGEFIGCEHGGVGCCAGTGVSGQLLVTCVTL